MTDNFATWIAEVAALAAADGWPGYVDQTGEDAWTEAFNGGASPEEAWGDEKVYAAQDAG